MGLLCPLPQAFSLSLLMERDPHGRICRLSQRRLPQQNASDRRLKPQTFVSHSRGVWKSQVRVPAGPVSAAGSPSGLETATFPASSRVGGERGTQFPMSAFKGMDHREAPASLPSKHQGLQIPSHSGLGFQPKQAMASARIPDRAIPLGGRHPCLCAVGNTRPARPSRGFPGRAPRPTARPRPSLASLSTSFLTTRIGVCHLCLRLPWEQHASSRGHWERQKRCHAPSRRATLL